MSVYISVVSHNHADMIMNMKCLPELANYFNVIIKNNVGNDSVKLTEYCKENNINIIDDDYGMGFGLNNNIVYQYCTHHLNMTENDLFILVNPDVVVTPECIKQLLTLFSNETVDIATIALYKDENYTIRDFAVRRYPTLLAFVSSLLGISKNYTKCADDVDWFAGSFMAFRSGIYQSLGGFDENYFMYCEDVDICYRAKQKGYKLRFYPDIKAIHKAQHNNRKILSKHFNWHVKSAVRFLLSKYINLPVKSIIK